MQSSVLRQSDLLVNLNEFSRIACLDGRLFGVQTFSDSCGLTLNACLRGQALEALLAANRRAERDVGYSLMPRYHVETITVKDPSRMTFPLVTQFPGISVVNVKQEITVVLSGQAVSPYVGFANLSDSGLGFCMASISTALVDNPSKITLRDANGKILRTHETSGFPRKVGGNWQIAIMPDDLMATCASISTANVQHSQLVHVDIPITTVCRDCNNVVDTDAQILPVYPGTTDFIPLAKPVETVGSFYRYWFNVWVLVDPAFQDEQVDLTHAEFWKLRSTVDFACVREVSAGPEVYCTSNCCDDTAFIPDPCANPPVESKYTVSVKDAVKGFLSFSAVKDPCGCGFPSQIDGPVTVKFYYKTDPAAMGFALDLPNIATAIAYRAAAELPSEFCGCEIKTGFIAEAQKSFGNARVNPITGETIWVFKFGDKNGHLMYEEKMASAPRYQKVRSA